MTTKPNRQEMLRWIDAVSFACYDAALFLDTHPDDQEALNYFLEYSKIRAQAVKEYSRCFTPLNFDSITATPSDYWKWVNTPWPWQEGGC